MSVHAIARTNGLPRSVVNLEVLVLVFVQDLPEAVQQILQIIDRLSHICEFGSLHLLGLEDIRCVQLAKGALGIRSGGTGADG
jgi:hypothetical protein